jgi:hypothetical protein
MDDIFAETESVSALPKVEEVQITNDIPKPKGSGIVQNKQNANENQQEKTPVKQDPRPHIASTKLFKYIVIGLVLTVIICVLIYVVRTYVLKPPEPVEDPRDDRLRELNDELNKIKENSNKLTMTITQLRRENQLQQRTIDELNEQVRFDKDGKPKSNSYEIPEATDEHVPTDREKFQEFINRNKHTQEDDESETGVASEHVEEVEGIDNEHDDDYDSEYEDVVDDAPEEEDVVEHKVVEIKQKKCNGKCKGKGKKSQETIDDDDILAIVTSST